MKFLQILIACAGVALCASAWAESEPEKPHGPLDSLLQDATLFSKPIDSVMTTFAAPLNEAQKQYLEKLRQKGGENTAKANRMEEHAQPFQWLSGAKDGLRADAGKFTLFDEKVGEVVIRANAGKIGPVSVSIFNRGDDGEISTIELGKRVDTWRKKIESNLGVRGETYAAKGTVATTGWMWRKNRTAWLLESSISKSENRPEFLRLRIASLDAANDSTKPKARGSLAEHVVRKDNGDVYIEGVPMVDQGQKGYCAVATTERVARYYGIEVDQHEMAQIAKTDDDGTSQDSMESALKRATGKLHCRTTKLIDMDVREIQQDVRNYNQAAKKADAAEFNFPEDTHILDPTLFWKAVKPEIFLTAKNKQNGFNFFQSKIKDYINQGVPLNWSLHLGMFKEEGIPQTGGGHMRLIIGYNEKTQEIIYSDSWGKGHEFKRMPAGHAWCMTTGLYAIAPTK